MEKTSLERPQDMKPSQAENPVRKDSESNRPSGDSKTDKTPPTDNNSKLPAKPLPSATATRPPQDSAPVRPVSTALKENPFLKKDQKPVQPESPEEPKSAIKENAFVKKEQILQEQKPAVVAPSTEKTAPAPKIGSAVKDNPFFKQAEEAKRKEEDAKKKFVPEIKTVISDLKTIWK